MFILIRNLFLLTLVNMSFYRFILENCLNIDLKKYNKLPFYEKVKKFQEIIITPKKYNSKIFNIPKLKIGFYKKENEIIINGLIKEIKNKRYTNEYFWNNNIKYEKKNYVIKKYENKSQINLINLYNKCPNMLINLYYFSLKFNRFNKFYVGFGSEYETISDFYSKNFNLFRLNFQLKWFNSIETILKCLHFNNSVINNLKAENIYIKRINAYSYKIMLGPNLKETIIDSNYITNFDKNKSKQNFANASAIILKGISGKNYNNIKNIQSEINNGKTEIKNIITNLKEINNLIFE